MLETGGFEVVTAKDGEAAWALLAGPTGFDACILDIMMPKLDGLVVAKRVREHAQLSDLPIILCTALNDRTTVDRASALSIVHYIVKPYAREHVLKLVGQVCAEREAALKLASFARTAQRLGIGEHHVAQLLGDVITETSELIPRLRATPTGADEADLRIRLNGLKGGAINLGASGLYESLATLEGNFGTGNSAALEDSLRDVERENSRLKNLLAARTVLPASGRPR